MIKNELLATLAATAVVAAGCNKPSPETTGGTNPAATEASAAASNALQSTKEGGSNLWNATRNATTNAWEATKETGSNAWEKAKTAIGSVSTNEVSTNYFGYDYSMKNAFVLEAKSSLDALDEKVSIFSSQVPGTSDSLKADLQQKLQDINAKRAELGNKYNDVKNATQDNWNDAKAAFVKAYFDAKATLKAGQDSLAAQI